MPSWSSAIPDSATDTATASDSATGHGYCHGHRSSVTGTDGTRYAGLRCGPPSSSSALSRCGDLVRGRVPGGYPVRRPSGLPPLNPTFSPTSYCGRRCTAPSWTFSSPGAQRTDSKPPRPKMRKSSCAQRLDALVTKPGEKVGLTAALPSVARAAWSCGERGRGDHAARASGGLPRCFDDAPWVRSPWIAKHAHCAQRASSREVDGEHNGVNGTSRPK